MASAAAGSALLGGAPRPDYGPLIVQLPWIKNVEWAGEYFADKRGYYRQAGFSSDTLLGSGSGSAPVEGLVAAGQAFVAISSMATTAAAIMQGAAVKTIGVQYQTSPYIIASPPDRPLRTPHDMIGKRIGVPGGNELTWTAFLHINAIDPGQIEAVRIGSSVAPLLERQVDGLLAFITNAPHALRTQGMAPHTFGLGEFGYPLVNNNYIVASSTLENRRDAVKALLRAEIRGWKASLASPALSAQLTVDAYGRDLGLALRDQLDQSGVQNALMRSADTRAHGLFTLTPSRVAQTIALLHASGLSVSAEQLFDLTPLNEVYAADPALR